jgi:hypothetical protein
MYQSAKELVNKGARRVGNVIEHSTGKVIGVVGGTLAVQQSAFAAVPATVTTAITDATTDVGTVGAAILGVIIIIAAFAWMRKGMH